MADYLEGGLTPVVKAACEVHLIGCDQCREKLAAYMRVLQPDISPEENAAIDEVVADWDRKAVPPVAQSTRGWWKQAYAYMAIAAVLVSAFLIGSFLFKASPDELIQSVLATFRPFEARLSGQPYVALTTTRGPSDEPDFELLGKRMTRTSTDAYQLGRFALIAREYDKAIQQLKTAAADQNAPPSVLNDLGVAYLNRNQTGDLDLARKSLEAAIALDSAFRPALFNLAILYDLEGLTADANQQLTRYLALDPDSEWAKELSNRISPKDR